MLIKSFTAFNAFLFQMTGGRLGSQMGGQSVLLLHTVGRKSGKPYITPLSFYRDGPNYLVVASNWGREQDPDWFRNLMQQPRANIQIRDRTIPVQAQSARGEEYQRLWSLVTSRNSQYLQYQSKARRQIPVVILTPLG